MSNNLYGDSSDSENDANVFKEEQHGQTSIEEDSTNESSNEQQGFTIEEDITSGSEEEEEQESESSEDEEESTQNESKEPSQPGKPKYFKLDYNELKKKKESRGVIFVAKPPEGYRKESILEEYFCEFGKITRIQPAVEGLIFVKLFNSLVKRKKRYLLGFYIEFEKKSIAKRVALTLNLAPIDRRKDSRTWQIKYMKDFNWAKLEEDEMRKTMYKKMMLAEAQKELRELQAYQKRKEWSKKIQKKKLPKPKKEFKFTQKRVNTEIEDTTHIPVLQVFKKQKRE